MPSRFPFCIAKYSILALVIFTASACEAETPSAGLAKDLSDGQLDDYALIEAAAMIGGMRPSQTSDAQRRVRDLANALDRQRHTDDTARLQSLLSFLHDRLFTGEYDTEASQIVTTLEHGDYNCASSAALFLVAADAANFSARAVLVPGHVRCRVWIEDQQRWLDIEPSVRSGIATANESAAHTSHAGAAVDDSRELTDVQFLAKLYYNLGIDQLKRRDFWSALRNARYGSEFDLRHTAAKENVAAIVNNWSLALSQQGKFEEALRLIRDGLQDAPQHHLLSTNEIHIYVSWMQALMQRGDLRSVEMRLHDALTRYPNSSMLLSIDTRFRQVAGGR